MSEAQQWRTAHRAYELNKHVFTKRELRPSELERNMDGEIISLPEDSKARLENEFLILKYLYEYTEIPVPKPLELKMDDGILILTTSCVAENAVALSDYAQGDRNIVLERVSRQLVDEIIPALRRHKSCHLGGMNKDTSLLLPPRVTTYSVRDWTRRTFERPIFVLSHNDLSQANIFIDPGSHKILAIVDWEYAGFYPPVFEAQLWKYHPREQDWDAHRPHELCSLLEELSTIRDSSSA